jgi:hypothetical protein
VDLGFVLQNPHRRQIVFHLLESRQHAMAVGSDFRIITRARPLSEGSASSHIEYGPQGRRPTDSLENEARYPLPYYNRSVRV